MEFQNTTVLHENQLFENDIGSLDNLTNKGEPTNDVITDGMSLDRVDISLRFEHGSENQGEPVAVCVTCEQPGLEEFDASEAVPDNVKVKENVESRNDAGNSSRMECEQISPVEQVAILHNDMLKNCGKSEENECGDVSRMEGAQISLDEQVEILHGDVLKKFEENGCGACDAKPSSIDQSTPPLSPNADEKMHVVVLGLGILDGGEKIGRGRKPKSATKNTQQQTSNRSLRSRSKEVSKDPEPSVNLETTKGRAERRGRKKGAVKDDKSNDEFSKMRRHLRYLLHRMKYAQNLLDAYSSEGWRGQSLEKLRPEQELERARSDINRHKLKIRDLFQRLESMLSEGKFPESLYDSDGLIDSEDIFCAKCGSKDLSTDNDILLCDGICERGFHQYCLNPPLPSEEIPPGDEGWLCPACDCKADCIDLINDSHGIKLSIEDNWEKVFPEAVATENGKGLDDIMGLPSDDSEDDEYNPDGLDDDANGEENESSSDESNSDDSDSSDFSSASEDLGAFQGAEKNLELPSDDSEDDDFDPDAANVNEDEAEHESSSSDFTSASEDLGTAIGDDGTSGKDEPSVPLELEQDFAESSPITAKRCVEKLDYKKLYDETYGNDASDSSDDEEWTNTAATRTRKNRAENTTLVLGVSTTAGTDSLGNPRKRGRPKANPQVARGTQVQLQDSSPKTSFAGSSRMKRTEYNKLGGEVTKRLYESFKENQYPDRETKEKLASELGLTAKRVDKWFGNARWSLHHHPSRVEANVRVVSSSNTSQSHSVALDGVGSALTGDRAVVPESVTAETCIMDGIKAQKLIPRKSSKNSEGDQSVLETSGAENLKEGTQANPQQEPEVPQGKVQRKRRKSST
ncbi:homeobox protein HAT3.1 [Amaranthus tricolor]|uniref:homeobox protein HAT3.1 n=1 Tax=Amaranthus tricolor TaxID=29722 RepID=UPI0025901BFD|nr:homeobox protein HAT3.1 [Amaranthus tricolor]XP_057516182.1 homeobox protein HAT3.1 [Amaranthus tricolor]